MYGYLRPDNSVLEYDVRRSYRERYCSLCHALWNYYGPLSRMLLSYDVTFSAILLDLESQVDFGKDKILCYKRNPIRSQQDYWKSIAAISVLLAAGKLRDNVRDEGSPAARLLLAVYGRTIRKAERDYPELAAHLEAGLEEMDNLEKEGAGVDALADAFARMMCRGYGMLCRTKPATLAVVAHVSRWVYFIDALDDLDKDVKKDRFNPFRTLASSREELLEAHWPVVEGFILRQREALLPYAGEIARDTLSGKMTRSILNDTIPEVTRRVMLGEPVSKLTSPHLRLIQAKGGIIFA